MIRIITPPMPGPYDPVDVTVENGLFSSPLRPDGNLIIDMINSIAAAKANHVTAPAIGYPQTALVIRRTDGRLVVMLNPRVIGYSGAGGRGGREKLRVVCMSIDGREYDVKYAGLDLYRVRAALKELGVL